MQPWSGQGVCLGLALVARTCALTGLGPGKLLRNYSMWLQNYGYVASNYNYT